MVVRNQRRRLRPAFFIAEAGEETERFRNVASRFLLAALFFLAPGMAGDIVVVFAKLSGSESAGILAASVLLVAFYSVWFGYSALARHHA